MRRGDREITDFQEQIAIMEKCGVCRLALNAREVPYIVPLNFGMEVKGAQVMLYFHSAAEGTKLELINMDNRVSFEMDCGHELILDEEKQTCSMAYESIVGRGLIEMVPEEEKMRALELLMAHYHQEEFPFNPAAIPRTAVYKLTVSEMTGKRRRKMAGERRA